MSHRGRRPAGWRRVVVVSVLIALAGLLPACGSDKLAQKPPPVTYLPAQGGTITVGIDQAPNGCNPNTATGDSFADRLVLSAVLPSAFTVDQTGSAQYDQALIVSAELQSTDPETVVYTINPKAVWSDGVPITATDFIYAWDHERAVPVGETTGNGNVASTAGYDDIATMTPSSRGRTLTVVFSTSYADWQSLFSDLLPAHVLERTGWSPNCTTVDPEIDLSGGPFELGAVGSHTITLVKNPKWWGQEPKIDRIRIEIASSPMQLATWLTKGEVDLVAPSYFTQDFLEDVSAIPTTTTKVNISNSFLELEFGTAAGMTAQPLVRDAVAYAIDRQQLTDSVVGWADVDIAPSTSHLYSQEQTAYPANPAPVPGNSTSTTTSTTVPASAAITAATFPTHDDPDLEDGDLVTAGFLRNAAGAWVDVEGHPLTLRMAVDDGDGWAAETAALLADQLKVQGIAVEIISEPSDVAAGEELQSGAADVALLALRTSPFATQASAWYSPLLDAPGGTGAQDWTGYASTKVDNLFSQAMSELDPVAAQPLYNKVDAQLWTDMVALPLFAEPNVLTSSNFVIGITAGPYSPGLFSSVLTWARLVKEPSTYSGTPTLPKA
ncbi:MAG: ABC transporter family substrate-binding protein [Acidimicrobiales bacterium]